MTTGTVPDPPDATWADRLQTALYPWLGRPDWWPPGFGDTDERADHAKSDYDAGDDR